MDTPSGESTRAGINEDPERNGQRASLINRVSCVRFSPNPTIPVIVSAGWDKVVKVSISFLFAPVSPNS